MIIQPANLRLSNPSGGLAATYVLSIIGGTPALPGAVLHTESGVLPANSARDYALAAWVDVPAGFAGFAKLESDQKLGFVAYIVSSTIDCTIRAVGGVGGVVTITYLGPGDAQLAPTYELTLAPGGSYACSAAEFLPPGYAQRVQFSAKFGLTFSYETVVEGLAK